VLSFIAKCLSSDGYIVKAGARAMPEDSQVIDGDEKKEVMRKTRKNAHLCGLAAFN